MSCNKTESSDFFIVDPPAFTESFDSVCENDFPSARDVDGLVENGLFHLENRGGVDGFLQHFRELLHLESSRGKS